MRRDTILVGTVIVSHFGPPFMFSAVAVALPSMGAELSAGASSLGLVETLFLAGSLGFLLPIGRLADAGGNRMVYKLGLFGLSLAALAIGLSGSILAVLGLRFLQGISDAAFTSSGPAILSGLVPAERRGRVFGLMLAVIYAGLTVGPMIGGLLVAAWGWRAVFLCGGGVLFAAALLTHVMLPVTWSRPRGAVHLGSAVLLVVAVLALVGGSSRVGRGGGAAIAAGLLLVVGFVIWQRRLPRPLLDVRALVANPVLAGALLVQALLYVSAFAAVFMLSLYLQVSLGLSVARSGPILATGAVVMAVIAPFAGALADRLAPRRVAAAGVVGVLLSALLATRLDASSSLSWVVLVLAVQGLGYGLFSSSNMTLLMNSVPAEQSSLASALGAMSRSVGMVIGMLVTAALISITYGSDPVASHPLRFISVIHQGFWVIAGMAALALVISQLRRA